MRTSFTGHWQLDIAASRSNFAGPSSFTLDIVDANDSIMVATEAAYDAQHPRRSTQVYTPDGVGRVVPATALLSTEANGSSTTEEVTSNKKVTSGWAGDTLVVTTLVTLIQQDIRIVERWVLDGGTLRIHREATGGDTPLISDTVLRRSRGA
ncbi:MAG: hypothetical protein ABIY52_09955 [Gemmatimonadaceae bacterium]